MKNLSPKASLIIPVYNFENFISETLETAFNQSYKNLEIIVVDDGSTDKSSMIVKDLQRTHSNLIHISQINQGVSVARNTGIEVATGEYILFSDADDLLHPDYVSYLVTNAIENNADLSVSTGIFTNYAIGNLTAGEDGKSLIRVIQYKDESLIKMLTYWLPIGCYCRAFRKNLFDKGLRFIQGQKVGEGFTFNIKAINLANKMVIGNKPVYCYRKDNTESCMTKFDIRRATEAVDSIGLVRAFFDNPSDEIQKAIDFAEWHTKGDMYNWMIISGNANKYPKQKEDYYHSIKKFAKKAWGFKLNRKERLRVLLQIIHPALMPFLLYIRKHI